MLLGQKPLEKPRRNISKKIGGALGKHVKDHHWFVAERLGKLPRKEDNRHKRSNPVTA